MKNLTTRRLAVSGMIGAAYAVMAIFGSVFGLTFGPIQFRFSEALCVTPFLFPEAVGGLFVGCLIANLFSPYGLLDIIIGSHADRRVAHLPVPQPVSGAPAAGDRQHGAGGRIAGL